MPYKFEKYRIDNPKNDRRVKLTEEDKQKIIDEYATGGISIRGLARKYNVSRRLIQFILFPDRQEKAKHMYKERRKDGRYYSREKHREYMKSHRQHKKGLWENGEIKPDEDGEKDG